MEWIDAATAAERLGVKPATLYAYVSRGVLRRRHGEDGRRSLFSAEEIERLARRGRPRSQPPELVIESGVTALGVDRPYYRGIDVLTLAGTAPFETVAEWLWTGDPAVWRPHADRSRKPGPAAHADRSGEADAAAHADRSGAARRAGRAGEPWRCEPDEALQAAITAQHALPDDLLPLDRLQVITTVLGASDTLRHHLDPASVAATGRRLIAGLVDALPPLTDPRGDSIAERLWCRLCPHPATPPLLTAMEAALVLLADHELAASTLAARVAASAKADPYAVVLTGLGVLGGPLHGGASYGAERLLAEIAEPRHAPRVIAERVRRGERIPGFGHSVYKNGDGRGAALLGLVKQAAPEHGRIAAGEAVLAEMRRRRLPDRNIDFALATLSAVSGMVPGAGEAIFAVARVVGWLAHAMEEYERGSLLRLRASYTGPPIK
ncbi:citrate synthase [Nonomuraea gerenzanensis]|uniref:citrate synthase (unknown stereospecificity) n=1 Tax=Nonomuraea gerenzanensis TaxID=93944 RepID=A0A1M4EJ43_9ACTN|nr:citrate synthase [Nonomuraea gerenzanensis]UBU10501.1 citrate synthase [Nonomuraea gerenzanensis]SBO98905.1 Citrate synthase (si) [Nonomuraea gerenzanensis]